MTFYMGMFSSFIRIFPLELISTSENFIGSKGLSFIMVIETLSTGFPDEPYLFELPSGIFECTFQSIHSSSYIGSVW